MKTKSNHGGPASSLTPSKQAISARNNSREAFEQVNGGKLTEPRKVKLTDQTVEHWEAVARDNKARERLALKPWEKKS